MENNHIKAQILKNKKCYLKEKCGPGGYMCVEGHQRRPSFGVQMCQEMLAKF